MKTDTLASSETNTPKYDFDKTHFNDDEAAAFINVSPRTLRKSRVTGKLLGKPAPKFRKRGRKVDTAREELEKFNAQFSEYENTAQYESKDKDKEA